MFDSVWGVMRHVMEYHSSPVWIGIGGGWLPLLVWDGSCECNLGVSRCEVVPKCMG